jgi:hypothetical protein
VKIDDGADRPRLPVLIAALRQSGLDSPAFGEFETSVVKGHGDAVGDVHACF